MPLRGKRMRTPRWDLSLTEMLRSLTKMFCGLLQLRRCKSKQLGHFLSLQLRHDFLLARKHSNQSQKHELPMHDHCLCSISCCTIAAKVTPIIQHKPYKSHKPAPIRQAHILNKTSQALD